jgi:hypothetical protein
MEQIINIEDMEDNEVNFSFSPNWITSLLLSYLHCFDEQWSLGKRN